MWKLADASNERPGPLVVAEPPIECPQPAYANSIAAVVPQLTTCAGMGLGGECRKLPIRRLTGAAFGSPQLFQIAFAQRLHKLEWKVYDLPSG